MKWKNEMNLVLLQIIGELLTQRAFRRKLWGYEVGYHVEIHNIASFDIYNSRLQSNHFCYFKINCKKNNEKKLFLKNI